MNTFRHGRMALALILVLTAFPVLSEEWKSLAQDQDVVLVYQAFGNQVRLRLSNRRHEAVTATWKLNVQLTSGTQVDNVGELNLEAGETETIASAPYLDAGKPVEVKLVTGTLSAKRTVP